VDFEIIGEIRSIETMASGRGIRILSRLNREHGKGNWRKLKGTATVRLEDGTILDAEVHWFEAHGIERKKLKMKRILSPE
jgi:hypothetical protein